MSLGSWNPEDGSESLVYKLDPALLVACSAFAAADHWAALPAWEAESLPGNASQMMKLDATQWHPLLVHLDENTLLNLIRFFTVAEQLLPHWHGGDKSPVIWISRLLKQRGTPLSREMVLWIKGNSDNRFLPNGPIL
ncbi:MAG TPA: hypothetical protein VLB90_10900 [Pseudomonadales bacterium]|nr:hypothetical protein [Pseudomonadales bacterium]